MSYFLRYVPPLDRPGGLPMSISIGFDNFEILKIDDRDFTVEINAYLIVKWKEPRVIIDFSHVSTLDLLHKYLPESALKVFGLIFQKFLFWLFLQTYQYSPAKDFICTKSNQLPRLSWYKKYFYKNFDINKCLFRHCPYTPLQFVWDSTYWFAHSISATR